MIYQFTNEIIRMPTTEFNFSEPPIEPKELFTNMKETLVSKGGLGLSCNQVGLPYSMFIMGVSTDPDNILAIFNPKIVDAGEKTSVMVEGCLSYPGMFVKVRRAENIRVRFTNEEGVTATIKLSGLSAKIFQHEYDHLQGKLFTDNCSKLTIRMAMEKARKKGYTYKMSDFVKN